MEQCGDNALLDDMYLGRFRDCFKDAYGGYYRVESIEYNAALSREVSQDQMKEI